MDREARGDEDRRVDAGDEDGNVVKVNIDKVPELASRYNIYAIPAILIFSNGKEYKRITGYNSEKTYVVALDELLS